MSKSFKSITQTINKTLLSYRKDAFEPTKGFDAMAKSAMSEGVLSTLQKELIATAIAVSTR
jgi:hypothetical protein